MPTSLSQKDSLKTLLLSRDDYSIRSVRLCWLGRRSPWSSHRLRKLQNTKPGQWQDLKDFFEKAFGISLLGLGKCWLLGDIAIVETAALCPGGTVYQSILKPSNMRTV